MTEVEPSVALARMIDLVTPFAVRAAVSLRLPELIGGGLSDVDSLAAEAGADRDALSRLLRHLVRAGLFTEPSPGTVGLSGAARELVGEGERKRWFRAWLDLDGPGARMDLAFSGMLHSIRTGQPAYASVHGRPFWAEVDADRPLGEFFHGVMSAHTWQTAPVLVKEYDWSSVRRVVDVGGGAGALLAELLRAHPHLSGVLVDRPSATAEAERVFAAAGLSDRAIATAGSFFETLPAGGDVYLVSRVLTDWNDEHATTILRRCAEAAAPEGRVLIVEVLPGAEHARNNSSFDLHMLVLLGGRERTIAGFGAIAADAGLVAGWSRTWEGGLTLVECRPLR